MADEAYVSKQSLLASTALSGDSRVTKQSLMVAQASYDIAAVQIRATIAKTLLTVGTGPDVRATTHWVLFLISRGRVILPVFPDEEELEYPYIATVEIPDSPIVEINPYRPDVPREYLEIGIDDVFYDFQRQVQETLRHQHNLLQVGDTTYHWFVLTKVTEDRKWTLGSKGRFYHEDWGMIHGRYVQFDKMIDSNWIGAPVGRLKTSTTTEWVVTNDILKSDRDQVMGFIASFEHINDRDYGWIITNGVNMYSILMEQAEIPEVDAPLVWSSTGKARAGISGRSFGRVVVPGLSANIPPGGAYIQIEGFTDNYYIDLLTGYLDGTLDAFQAILNNHESRIDALEAEQISVSIAALMQRITNVENRLTVETNNRILGDNQIRVLIDGLPTFNDLTVLENSLISYINSADAALTIQIVAAQTRADQAYALAASLDSGDIDSQINAHTVAIEVLNEQMELAIKVYMPLVNGDVPPTLMYNEDGSLIYVEVDVGH